MGLGPQEGAEPKTRTAGELSELIQALRTSHTVEAVPAKRPGSASRAERPVTTRIRRQKEAPREDVIAEPEAATEPREKAEEPPAPTLPPVARKPAGSDRFENRRKRYQKFLF